MEILRQAEHGEYFASAAQMQASQLCVQSGRKRIKLESIYEILNIHCQRVYLKVGCDQGFTIFLEF